MKKSISWLGIATAFALISGCANSQHFTSAMGDDTPVTMGGAKVAREMPGSQGPVADNSRLAINHRDVALRERAARERLAHDAEARRRTQVTDETYRTASAPVATTKKETTETRKVVKHHGKKKAARAASASDKIRQHRAAPARTAHALSPAVAELNEAVALNELHHINQKEIRMAKLADSRATSDTVKASAARIRKDHEALEARVEEVAKRRDVDLASYQPATYEGVASDRLEKLQGADFDLAFTQGMEDGHRAARGQLQILRARATDPEVVALIDQALPKVEQHRAHSQNVLSSIKTNNEESARR